MTPSQESTGEPRGRALAIAILGLAALSLAVFIFIAFPKNEFKSKFSKIQLDMTEDEVDQLLDGHPQWRDDFNVAQTEAYGPPDGPCKRSPLFRKWFGRRSDDKWPGGFASGLGKFGLSCRDPSVYRKTGQVGQEAKSLRLF